ncbi:MAG: glycosyltransferase 87 family protein [Gaiellaceae bacterium]
MALGAAIVLGIEWLRGNATLNTPVLFPLLQGAVAASALFAAWRRRDKLRLPPVLLLGLAFQIGWIAIHLHLGVQGDTDPTLVYPSEGHILLHGHYPKSEYPPGAVALFALETWLGGGGARTANALLMIPFQMLCVASVWALRTRWSNWLAAVLALWPANAFFWEFRFDLIPAAALLAGLVLARRGYWYESGFVLGLGTVVKWTPALAAGALVLWLVRSRRHRLAALHLFGLTIPVLIANIPLVLWDPSALVAAYTTQNARPLTAESSLYLPLRLFGIAKAPHYYWESAVVPAWANQAASLFQVFLIVVALALVVLARNDDSAIGLAALLPAVFLLSNRIFSPQFFVIVLPSLLLSAAVIINKRRELLAIVAMAMTATLANVVLYPSFAARPLGTIPGWTFLSVAAFVPCVLAVLWLAVRGLGDRPPEPSGAGSGAERRVTWVPGLIGDSDAPC